MITVLHGGGDMPKCIIGYHWLYWFIGLCIWYLLPGQAEHLRETVSHLSRLNLPSGRKKNIRCRGGEE